MDFNKKLPIRLLNTNMQKPEIIKVDFKTKTISCDGDEDSLGHPAVYFTFESQKKIVCNYC